MDYAQFCIVGSSVVCNGEFAACYCKYDRLRPTFVAHAVDLRSVQM